MAARTLAAAGIVAAAALALALSGAFEPPAGDPGSGGEQNVVVGAIIPLSGDLSSVGEDVLLASRLGVDDFNAYLEGRGAQWRLEMSVEDSMTRPVTALDKMAALKARGIDLVLGPLSSAEVRHVKGYADSNDMVIVSCCSNAPSLAIPDDSVFRINQDHRHLGPALAHLMRHEGAEVVIPVWRGDTWGDGLHDHIIGPFEDLGGRVGEGIRYVPDAPDFSASVSLLAEEVGRHAQDVGPGAVAVMYVGFDEATILFQTASDYDSLSGVRWYGTNANTGRSHLIDDPVASEFAHGSMFTAMQIASDGNPVFERIRDHALEELGRTPPSYIYSSYDAAWVLGLAIERAGADPAAVAEAIPDAAGGYVGALGDIRLNEAGDLEGAGYEILGIRDGKWAVLGTYVEGGDVVVWDG